MPEPEHDRRAKQYSNGGGCAWHLAPSGGRSGRGTPRSHWPPGRSAGSRATPAPRRRPTCAPPHRGQSQPYGSTASRHVATLRSRETYARTGAEPNTHVLFGQIVVEGPLDSCCKIKLKELILIIVFN